MKHKYYENTKSTLCTKLVVRSKLVDRYIGALLFRTLVGSARFTKLVDEYYGALS